MIIGKQIDSNVTRRKVEVIPSGSLRALSVLRGKILGAKRQQPASSGLLSNGSRAMIVRDLTRREWMEVIGSFAINVPGDESHHEGHGEHEGGIRGF
jgi:hypothetical protein